ncbi:unnamed protein product [Linum tenue]|uniref:RNase H type-1 domain-containing protein n=1 Tax=Linum tenue TaxID=586396 RepID=A0AAV0NTI3_9ROSI|nr:unnamed protein product [Linum tenue]
MMRELGGGNYKHIKREANEVAHKMAHSMTNWEERQVWLDRPPVFIVDQIKLDDVAATSD